LDEPARQGVQETGSKKGIGSLVYEFEYGDRLADRVLGSPLDVRNDQPRVFSS